MRLKNFMEDVAVQALEDYLREHRGELCTCPRCRRDILALTLNQLRARYVGSEEGEIRASVAQSDRQVKADVTLALLKAIEAVRAHPHHNRERG
ncbi:MAG: late competence development ComFB family protein [Bacillota bacterium]|nr:late competence development ComFB family protein [Bacillota bacterium]